MHLICPLGRSDVSAGERERKDAGGGCANDEDGKAPKGPVPGATLCAIDHTPMWLALSSTKGAEGCPARAVTIELGYRAGVRASFGRACCLITHTHTHTRP